MKKRSMGMENPVDKGEILDIAQGILNDAKMIFSEEDPRELRDALIAYLGGIAELQTKVVSGLNALDYAIELNLLDEKK